MWSSQGGWGQWPQNPFSNLSSEDVDWASLAKQWIAQREVMSSSVPELDGSSAMSHAAVGALPPPPPPPPPPPSDSESLRLQMSDNANTVDSCNSQDSTEFGLVNPPGNVPPENWNNWSASGWGMPGWGVPPPPPPMPDSGTMFPGEHYQPMENMPPAYGFDHNFGPFYDQSFNPASSSFQYWNAPNSHHSAAAVPLQPTPAFDYRPPSKKGLAGPVHAVPTMPSVMDDNFLDMAKRRQLPAWIREGLEKMEREKQRQMEKERFPASNAPSGLHDGDNMSDKTPSEPAKSRFDSDDDSDREVDSSAVKPEVVSVKREAPVVEEPKTPVMSEEEKQVQIMLKVRQMLTEVLLDVTNQEIVALAKSVLKSAKTKQARAPAKQLAKSSALASITSLGLGYGSESDDNEDKPESESSGEASATSEDEDTVRWRIAVKKREFAKKMSRLEEPEEEPVHTQVQQNSKKGASDDTSRLEESVAVQQSQTLIRSEGERVHLGDALQTNEPRHKGRPADEVKMGVESQKKKYASSSSDSESRSTDGDASEPQQTKVSRSFDDRMVGRGSSKYDGNDRAKVMRLSDDSFDRTGSVSKSNAETSKRKDRRHSEKSEPDKDALIADSNHKKQSRHDFDDSHTRHSSESRDRSSRKSKRSHHKSSSKKKREEESYDSRGKHVDRSVSKTSSHKSRKRSYSSSDASDDYQSHRHHHSSKSARDKSRQQRHRSPTSPESPKVGNSGKKLHAKRKYRSSSRSSVD